VNREQELTSSWETLKVRVEEAEEVRNKKNSFWSAVGALMEQVSEDKVILEPQSNGIHEMETQELLGKVGDLGYEWKDERLQHFFSGIDLGLLRRRTNERRRGA